MTFDDMTRAELLEKCQAAGLKATGWKKARMAEELARLAGNHGEVGESTNEADEPPPVAPGGKLRSGWCQRAPAWSEEHLICQSRLDDGLLPFGCGCSCHLEGWVRPAAPEGAQFNRFRDRSTIASGSAI